MQVASEAAQSSIAKLKNDTDSIRKWHFRCDDTAVFKGLAIILMLLHHAFFFPDRIAKEFYQISYIHVGDMSLMSFISGNGKICVAMFFFLSGFGLIRSCKNGLGNRIIKTLKKLYQSYWKVLFIFVPIGFIFFSHQIPWCENEMIRNAWNDKSIKTAISALFGFSEEYNHEWWFLRAYIITILTMPIFKKCLDRCKTFWAGFSLIMLIEIILTVLIPFMQSETCPIAFKSSFIMSNIIFPLNLSAPFYIGMLMGKDEYLEKMHDKLDDNGLGTVPFATVLFLAVFLIRYTLGEGSDILTVPILAISVKTICDAAKPLKQILIKLGNHSTTMWLTHTFLIYYYGKTMQGIIMFQHWWIITATWFVIVSFIIALIFDKIMSLPSRLSVRKTSSNNDNENITNRDTNIHSNKRDDEADSMANSSILMAVHLKRCHINTSLPKEIETEQ